MKNRTSFWRFIVLLFTICSLLHLGVHGEAGTDRNKAIEQNGVTLFYSDTISTDGKVTLTGTTSHNKIKLLVKKDKVQIWYDVKLESGSFSQDVWLAEGKGIYTLAVMVHEFDRKYSYGPQLSVENAAELNNYLSPEKYIESSADSIIALAQKITEDCTDDMTKAKAIYDWMVENIEFDYEKYSKHQNGYYDNAYGALSTLETGKGVCFDYSTLTAALGRASGLQVKLVTGLGSSGSFTGYHAWNEIFIVEQNRWINVDTTFGTTQNQNYFDNSDFFETHSKQD